jgi:hypothetical protein
VRPRIGSGSATYLRGAVPLPPPAAQRGSRVGRGERWGEPVEQVEEANGLPGAVALSGAERAESIRLLEAGDRESGLFA